MCNSESMIILQTLQLYKINALKKVENKIGYNNWYLFCAIFWFMLFFQVLISWCIILPCLFIAFTKITFMIISFDSQWVICELTANIKVSTSSRNSLSVHSFVSMFCCNNKSRKARRLFLPRSLSSSLSSSWFCEFWIIFFLSAITWNKYKGSKWSFIPNTSQYWEMKFWKRKLNTLANNFDMSWKNYILRNNGKIMIS